MGTALHAWRSARQVHYQGALNDVRVAYVAIRRWSPLVVPLALEVVLLILAIFLARHSVGASDITAERIGALAAVLLVLGALLGPALYVARSDIGWVTVLTLGAMLYLVATALVLFGTLAALLVGLLLVGGVTAMVRERLHPVMEGTVHITTLFGKYNRTLLPGLNVLLPSERVLAILQTRQREYTTLPQRVVTGAGEERQATATMLYQLSIEHAHLAVLATHDWERTLHRLLVTALREALGHWHADLPQDDVAFPTGGAPAGHEIERDSEQLRQMVEQRIRREAEPWGVRLLSLHVRDVRLSEVPYTPRAPEAAGYLAPRVAPRVVEGSLAAQMQSDAEPQVQQVQQVQQGGLPPPPLALSPATTRPLPPLDLSTEQTAEQTAERPDDLTAEEETPPEPVDAPNLLARLSALVSGFSGWGHTEQDAEQDTLHHAEDEREPEDAASRATPGAAPAEQGTRQGHGMEQGMEQRAVGPEPPEGAGAPRAPSSRVLAAAYEAVREGQITDPETVRQIADSFARFAAFHDPDDEPEFDAEAAARILHQRAASLALERGPAPDEAMHAGHAGGAGSGQRPSFTAAPRDENVTRGG